MPQVLRHAVSDSSFDLGPDKLVRIELGGIAWKEMGMDAAMAAQELLDGVGLVRAAPIPQQNEGTSDVPQKMAEKFQHLLPSNIFAGVQSKVESQSLLSGRHTNRGDGRNLGPISSHHQNRRPSPGRPRPRNAGNQKEPRLIQEDQMRPNPLGFFLYPARRGTSSGQWPPRSSREPSSWASGNSIPSSPSASKHSPRSNAPRSASRSLCRSASTSTGRWGIRTPKAPLSIFRAASSFPAPTDAGDVPGWGASAIPPDPSADKPDTTAPPNSTRRAIGRPPTGRSLPTLRVEWHEDDASLRLPLFLWVSCPIVYQIWSLVSIV
jgi:hypothetical protein